MDHKDLVAIKLRRGFVESPTGGFVRSTNWQAVRLARMARTHQELTGRVEKLAAELGLAAKSVAAELVEEAQAPAQPQPLQSPPPLPPVPVWVEPDPTADDAPTPPQPPPIPQLSESLKSALIAWAAESNDAPPPQSPPPPPPPPEILSWPKRLILLARISWCLLRQGSKSAIRDILDGPNG